MCAAGPTDKDLADSMSDDGLRSRCPCPCLSSAGLAVRCIAAMLDAAVVLGLTLSTVALARRGDTYVPFELTFLVLWLAYASSGTIWRQRTAGKWALGLSVQSYPAGRPGVLRVLWRETLAKFLALLPLGLGVWWIGVRQAKRGWHDYLAGTKVVQQASAARRRRWVMPLAGGAAAVAGFTALGAPAWLYIQAARLSLTVPARDSRAAAVPRDLRTLSSIDRAEMENWFVEHARAPEEYAVETAARHQLTIFGEFHHVADNLQFLARIIPDLYHRAGVTCLAMEALLADDNDALNQLLTAREFDRSRALALARHEGWKSWGSSEYWDALEAVWRVNRTLRPDQPPLRVVGLDREWDMPSWSLVGLGDDARPGRWWERLRLLRVLPDLPTLAKRDELMVCELEREVFAQGQRAIVWVGAAHAYTDHALPLIFGDPNGPRRYRMGAILRQRYGQRVCHLRMHDSAIEGPALAALIESVHQARGNGPSGFEITGSPFADLRDPDGLEYRRDPAARFDEFTDGYIFLKPLAQQRHCSWEPGFITQAMFLRDKPFFEAQTGRTLHNAAEANEAFRQRWEK
jgi:uncharacterized RDD family membrane protein YckC